MKYFQHRSAGSLREMFLELDHQIKQEVKCRKANCFGPVCDEVCDLSNKEQPLKACSNEANIMQHCWANNVA